MKSMIKKISVLMAVSLMLGGCGSARNDPSSARPAGTASSYADAASSSASVQTGGAAESADLADTLLGKEGNVVNIYCYNRRLLDLFRRYYPAYRDSEDSSGAESQSGLSEEHSGPSDSSRADSAELSRTDAEPDSIQSTLSGTDGASGTSSGGASSGLSEITKDGVTTVTGMIGRTKILWTIIEHDPQKYQSTLDERLMDSGLKRDERIDLYEAYGDDLQKYTDADADVSKPLSRVGIYDSSLSDQFDFTRELASDENGKQRALTWQLPSGCFVYRRDYARAVLGSDDPETVQKSMDSWKHLSETASALVSGGYQIFSDYTSPFAAFLNQRTEAWVDQDDQLVVDKSLNQYVDLMKKFSNEGCVQDRTATPGEADRTDYSKDSRIFGAFLTSLSMAQNILSDSTTDVRWGVIPGPASFWRGGDYLLIGSDNDNPSVTSEMIRDVLLNRDILGRETARSGVLTNSKSAMKKLEQDSSFSFRQVAGQNYLSCFETSAQHIDTSLMTYYDSTMGSCFTAAFLPYFRGTREKADALHDFYQRALKEYPDLLNS